MNRLKSYFILIFFFVFAGNSGLFAEGGPKLKFHNINKLDGLPNNNINAIVQDSFGFMWVGTNDGLARYEAPGKVKVFKPSIDVEGGLRSSDIHSLFVDRKNNVWIGTRLGGLTRFHAPTGTWKTFINDPEVVGSISDNDVLSILEDKEGRLWVGTENGLNLYQPETESFIVFKMNKEDSTSLQGRAILSIMEDDKGWIWIGTWEEGLHLMLPSEDGDVTRNTFRRFFPSDVQGSQHVWTIYQDKQKGYWIGTHGGGLLFMDLPFTASAVSHRQNWDPVFYQFTYEHWREGSLSNNIVQDILEDKKGQLWVGTNNGVNLINRTNFPTLNAPVIEPGKVPTIDAYDYTYDKHDQGSLAHNNSGVIYEDQQGLIWIGTFGGLSIYNWYANQFDLHICEIDLIESENLYVDREGIAWLACGLNGVIKYDFKSGEKTVVGDDIPELKGKEVFTILPTKDEFLYFGLKDGILKLNLKTRNTQHFPLSEDIASDKNWIFTPSMYKDDYSRIWVATSKGLILIDEETGNVTRFVHNPEDDTSISDNSINSLFPDSKGNLWLTTYYGLNRINLKDKNNFVFEKFFYDYKNPKTTIASNRTIAIEEVNEVLYIGSTNGLSTYDLNTGKFDNPDMNGQNFWIQSMEKTEDGRIWGSTTEGVFYFNTNTKMFNVFEEQDGLGDNTFQLNSSYVDHNGYIYFGSRNGITRFHPDKIIRNKTIPPVYITDIKTMNSKTGASEISAINIDEHTLYHDDYYISFDFAGLNYNRAEKNRYAYKLEGFEDEWNYTNTVSPVVYTNLEHGTYTFQVKAANNDGVWNEQEAAITIVKKPAFWETIWFAALSFISFCLLCLFCAGLYTKGIRSRNQRLLEYNETLSNEIKQRKRIEKALEESKHFVRLILDNIPQYIYWVDKNHCLSGGNDAFLAAHEITEELDVVGKNMSVFHKNEMHFFDQRGMEQKVMESGIPIYDHQYRVENKDKSDKTRRWMEQNLIPLLDENKEVIGVLVSLEDISTRMEAESILKGNSQQLEIQVEQRTKELHDKNNEVQQLLSRLEVRNEELEKIVQMRTANLSESNKELKRNNKDLEQFAYVASHDLKEPLRIVGNFVGLLSRKYKDSIDDTANEFIFYIEDGVKRMSALIDSILNYSGVGKKEIVLRDGDLNNILEIKMRDLSQRIQEKNVDLEIRELPVVFCEASQIGMVFYNLINNAIKFNKNEKPRVVVTSHEDGEEGFWTFSVADNGIGIAPEFQDKIFEIFRRLHSKQEYEGTGIGLALCHKIIERHGGRIWIESEPGNGATFFFTIDKSLTMERANATEERIASQATNYN